MSGRTTLVETSNYTMALEHVKGFGWFMHFTIKNFSKTVMRETFLAFEEFKSDLARKEIKELFGEVMEGDNKHTKFVLMYGGEPFVDNYVDGTKKSTIYRWEL